MHYQDSIEYKVDLIYHQKTKEYFEEVLSSYNNGNYRSAIVMLYSVVICDLIYKLNELSERYSDQTAISILNKIKEEQENADSFRSKWESTLIKEVKERTHLFEANVFENFEYLKNQRHLSAHPTLDNFDILLKPNRDTVRANITNMLDGLLCKSPLLSNRLIITLLTDLESVKDVLILEQDFERYLNSKYFSRINKLAQEKLFRDLWKFSFKLDDEKTTEIRGVIYKTLLVLHKKDPNNFKQQIENEKGYYSEVKFDNDIIFDFILEFLSYNPVIYHVMESSVKVIYEKKAESNLAFMVKSVFLANSFDEHLKKLNRYINSLQDNVPDKIYTLEESSRIFLYSFAEKNGQVEQYLDFLIKLFRDVKRYDNADVNFNNYIITYKNFYSIVQFRTILDAIKHNSQINNRRRAESDNRYLRDFIEKKYPGQIDFTEYNL